MKRYKSFRIIAFVFLILCCVGIIWKKQNRVLKVKNTLPCINIAIPSLHEAADTELVNDAINKLTSE